MRIKLLSACVIAASTLGAATLATAQPLERAGYIGAQGARMWYDDKMFGHNGDRLDDHAMYGGQIGWRMSRHFSMELSFTKGDSDKRSNPTGDDYDVSLPLASFRYHFANQSRFEPYLGLAAGEMWVEHDVSGSKKHRETVTAPELGLQTRLARNLVLDLGARAPYSIDNDRWHGQAYAGLNVLFGVRDAQDEVVDTSYIPPEPVQVVEEPKPQPKPEPQVVRRNVSETHTATFGFDDATLSASNRADLVSAARFLRDNPSTTVTLEGHTCSVGPAEYNQYLSERRAESARKLLENEGVDASRIKVIGKGEAEPIADNNTREGRAKNRRVEAIITGTVEERR